MCELFNRVSSRLAHPTPASSWAHEIGRVRLVLGDDRKTCPAALPAAPGEGQFAWTQLLCLVTSTVWTWVSGSTAPPPSAPGCARACPACRGNMSRRDGLPGVRRPCHRALTEGGAGRSPAGPCRSPGGAGMGGSAAEPTGRTDLRNPAAGWERLAGGLHRGFIAPPLRPPRSCLPDGPLLITPGVTQTAAANGVGAVRSRRYALRWRRARRCSLGAVTHGRLWHATGLVADRGRRLVPAAPVRISIVDHRHSSMTNHR